MNTSPAAAGSVLRTSSSWPTSVNTVTSRRIRIVASAFINPYLLVSRRPDIQTSEARPPCVAGIAARIVKLACSHRKRDAACALIDTRGSFVRVLLETTRRSRDWR
jgi:hypothetical protein